GTWVALAMLLLAIGAAAVVWGLQRGEASASAVVAPLTVSSRPTHASAWLDGRQLGNTPLQVQVEPGEHHLQLNAPDALEARYLVRVDPVSGAALQATL